MKHNFSVHFFAVVLHDYNVKLPEPSEGLFTWSGGPRSSGVGFFCFHSLGDAKQKKPTPLDRGPPLHVNRVLVTRCRTCSRSLLFFSLPLIFTFQWWPLAFLIFSPSLQYFYAVLPMKKCLLCFFVSCSRSLSPFSSLSFAGLPPTFSNSIFQICGHDN